MAKNTQATPQKAASSNPSTKVTGNTRAISGPSSGAPVLKMASSKGKGC